MKILFICPPCFFDDHLEIFKNHIGFFISYNYTVVIKSVHGFDSKFRSTDALKEIENEGYPFTILGGQKNYSEIQPSDKVFFIEKNTTADDVMDIFKKILKQRV